MPSAARPEDPKADDGAGAASPSTSPARRARVPIGAVEARSDEAASGAPSFTATLCDRHRGWVVNEADGDRLPAGWRSLVTETFAEVAGVVGTSRYALRRLEEEMGGLAVVLSPIQSPIRSGRKLPDSGHVTVSRLIEEAGDASRRLCQSCGAPGRLRLSPHHVTLCDQHAATLLAATKAVTRPVVSEPAHHRRPVSAAARDAAKPVVPEPARIALYSLSDVVDALGLLDGSDEARENVDVESPENDHSAFLRRILNRGEGATWRELATPDHDQVAALDDLDRRAPHFAGVTDLVRRHLRAAIAIGLPTMLPPIMLLGEPGFGKSWYVGRLAAVLALPVRNHPMNATTLGEGLMGSHPIWRNARPGLVARTLLHERVANPLVLVDEFDKPPMAHNRGDPYRPFYTLLEPEGAKVLMDEYLGFPLDASRVSWILAGNSIDDVPAPIVDRLTVLTVPAMDEAQRRAVAASIYAEGNTARRHYFDPTLPDDVSDRLVSMTARGMRRALGEAMVRAAAEDRRALDPDDVVVEARPAGRRVGFRPWS